MNTKTIKLIYAGGTFGCHGTPLAPLDADVFLPNLLKQLSLKTDNSRDISIIDNALIKDSSQLTPADFVYFYQLILNNYHLGYRRFVLITGTDTLSYLGAFFAECFAGSDIILSLTASMKPLFNNQSDIENKTLVIDNDSDAWTNLQGAINHCYKDISGVYICLLGNNWTAQSVQKLDSHKLNAFVGNSERTHYPANSFLHSQQSWTPAQRQEWAEQRLKQIPKMAHKVGKLVISSVFVMPNHEAFLPQQLQSILINDKQNIAVILLGFGAGNLPYSKQLAEVLDIAYQQGQMIIASTQCPFGGVSDSYTAGSWQYQHHVLSAGRLTKEAIYARILWLYLNYDSANERRKLWKHLLNQ